MKATNKNVSVEELTSKLNDARKRLSVMVAEKTIAGIKLSHDSEILNLSALVDSLFNQLLNLRKNIDS